MIFIYLFSFLWQVVEANRSIQVNLPKIKEQKLMPQIFAKMSKLKFMKIYGEEDNYDFYDQFILAKELQLLATELRFLYWIITL